MSSYTVSILVCRETDRVLVCRRYHSAFNVSYTGICGKLDNREKPVVGAIRAVREKTGMNIADRMHRLGKIQIQVDPKERNTQGCILHYFTADVSEDEVRTFAGNSKDLTWLPVVGITAIPVCSDTITGYGSLQYFTFMALHRVYNFGGSCSSADKLR